MRVPSGKNWSQTGNLWSLLVGAILLLLPLTLGQPMSSSYMTYKFDRNATDGNVTVNYMTPHEEVAVGKPISK